jgi:hypothetical protein
MSNRACGVMILLNAQAYLWSFLHCSRRRIMKILWVREIARELGLNPGKAGKVELIRAIQIKEGYFDCFATAYAGVCDQTGCRWREDCFAAVRGRKKS